MPHKDQPIFILGAGAWGLSTAFHLNKAGYQNITVFEAAESIPSQYSAGYDLNKIVRAEYEDSFYTDLALEAIRGWKTPEFGPYYHQTGYIVATSGKAPQKAKDHLEKALHSVSSHPTFASQITPLKTDAGFRDAAWQFSGPLTGFAGYMNRLAGYAHSSDAMYGIWKLCAARGVKFITGSAGKVIELTYAETRGPNTRRCTGIRTADGQHHQAVTVICALGAYAASLIPAVGNSVVARCWSVAHVQLNKTESDYLRGLPVTNVHDLGFFFEPDPETRLFKLCPLGAGYTNTITTKAAVPSLYRLTPPDAAIGSLPAPQDFIPADDERKLRRLLQETLPWLANRPFVDQKLCWFADTADSDYVIDFVPQTLNSLVVVSGDSGHGFKMMPVFGKWVLNLLEAGQQDEARWKWRQDIEKKDWGDEVSWRIGASKEVSDLIKEKRRLEQARL
ncbi:hypothetical protein PMZ80_000441 [Knufia obscura]|uniref:FAD dependent oxidoreductase domain-containing protein n=1 Tax=Knufia obscura TaxID=1635080 RepID=A0ABR0S1T9_9EURO|nr:hypothetical protein PMZ80_000441 [Knufia obscura]